MKGCERTSYELFTTAPHFRGHRREFMALEPGPPSSLPVNPDTKVDISSLTWEDKERVLRLLFGKINNIQVQQCSIAVR